MLTPRQQAAINTLTETTLMIEMAEQTARDIERDRLSRTLPRAAQTLRRRLCRAAATVHEHLHTRARARVLRLGVPTGHHYDAQSAGGTYRVFLFTDYTLDVSPIENAQAAAPTTGTEGRPA